MLSLHTRVQAAEESCNILLSTSDFEISIFYPDDGSYLKGASVRGRDYSISPDQTYLAVETAGPQEGRVDGRQVVIYRFVDGRPVQLAVVLDVALIRGSAWSHDGTRLLLQDGYSNRLLYLYDLKSQTLQFLEPHFDPTLQVQRVIWSQNDKFIAFAATESRQSLGIKFSGITALYILEAETLNYHPISLPTENVNYYFDSFYWTDDQAVAFTSCSVDQDICGIKQVTVDAQILAAFEGEYLLVGYDGNNKLHVLNTSQLNLVPQGNADLLTLDLHSKSLTLMAIIPGDQVSKYPYPYPIFSISDNNQWLVYINHVDEIGDIVVRNLQTSSTQVITQEPYTVAQTWEINGNRLLILKGSSFYIYDMETSSSDFAFDYSEDGKLYRYDLLCSSYEK